MLKKTAQLKHLSEKKLAIFSIARSDFAIVKDILIKLDNLNLNTKIYLYLGPGHSDFFGSNFDLSKKFFKNIKIYKANINYKENNNLNHLFLKNFEICNKFIKEKKISHCIITGDRYEALAYAVCCLNQNINIAHLCGGGTTLGSLDEKYRNCISNLSNLHFVETFLHKKKIQKHGIFKNIYIVGAPGLSIKKKFLIKKNVLVRELMIPKHYIDNVVPVLFHSETILDINKNLKNLKKLINFLKLKKHYYIILYPNADHGYDKFISIINNLKFKNFKILKSLKPNEYHSLLNISKFMIGNSSSGIIETAFFNLPVINLGDRQKGRPRNSNVVDSSFSLSSLNKNYNQIISKKFLKKVRNIKDIYYKKNCTSLILKVLRNNDYL